MESSFKKREKSFAYILLLPSFLFISVFSFYPILSSILLSFQNETLGISRTSGSFAGLDNYRKLLNDAVAVDAFTNTFIFAAITVFFEILFGLAIALIMNEAFRGRGIVRAAILIPWAIPTVVSSQMWRFIFNDQYGFANYLFFADATQLYRAWLAQPSSAFGAIIVADVWKSSSFAALLILAGLQAIPDELYESARIDGAGRWQRFLKITLPLLTPAILVAVLFRTIDAFRVFDLIFVMTQGGPGDSTNVIQFYGYKKIFAEGQLGYGSSISVSIFVVLFAISLIYIRFLGKDIKGDEG